jgi:hypothetical protein
LVPLSSEKVCEIRAGCPGPQDEDAHRGKTLPHPFGMFWSQVL